MNAAQKCGILHIDMLYDMKKIFHILVFAAVSATMFLVSSCKKEEEKFPYSLKETTWVCNTVVRAEDDLTYDDSYDISFIDEHEAQLKVHSMLKQKDVVVMDDTYVYYGSYSFEDETSAGIVNVTGYTEIQEDGRKYHKSPCLLFFSVNRTEDEMSIDYFGETVTVGKSPVYEGRFIEPGQEGTPVED